MKGDQDRRVSTQDLARALLAWPVFLVLLLVVYSTSQAGVSAPLVSTGQLEFSADMPVFLTDGGARLDLAVSVYHPQIRFVERPGGDFEALLRLDIKLARQGSVAVERSQEFHVFAENRPASLDPVRFALLEFSELVPPGRWAVSLKLRDLRGKTGFRHHEAEAIGVLEVPELVSGTAQLSDLEFRTPSGQSDQVPNPERVYGVTADSLIVYFELSGAAADRPYGVTVEIRDPQFGFSQTDSVMLGGSGPHRAAAYTTPLGTFVEGLYELYLWPQWEGGEGRMGAFQVTWSMDRIVRTARDAELELKLVFDGDELADLLEQPRTLQIAALEGYWARLDPTRGTERNEVYEEFKARVAFARRQYATHGLPGPLTDRGRTYIRYGPPAEIEMEVIPSNDEAMEEAVIRVHDEGQLARYGMMAKRTVPLNEPIPEAKQDAERFLRGSPSLDGAFEMWIYEMDGDRLVEDGPIWPEGLNLRFLFVDQLGTGEYRMQFTNYPFGRN